jgi:hypothetical protein
LIHVCFDKWISQLVWRRKSKDGKEKPMSNNHENRVLTRRGARQLTSDELEQINGAGGPFTRASLTGTGTMLSTDSDMDS